MLVIDIIRYLFIVIYLHDLTISSNLSKINVYILNYTLHHDDTKSNY